MVDLTATQLAERLGVTTRRARDLLRSETITGRQLANGTWLADSDAVARYKVSANRGSSRTLDAATAWGLLWELFGLDAGWLSSSTRASVRRRIRDSDAAAIAAAVSKHAQTHRFTSANAELVSAGLIRTGRAAVSVLGLPAGHLVYAKGSEDARIHCVQNAGVTITAHVLDLEVAPDLLIAEVESLAGEMVRRAEMVPAR